MKTKVIIGLFLAFLVFACKRNVKIDISFVDESLMLTDSLNNLLTDHYNKTLKGIYKITEDSILADSISKRVIVPDTFQFYEYLQYNIARLEDMYYLVQQEIYFASDQLTGLKEDVDEKQISPIQYELEIESQNAMIDLLVELVDSNLAEIVKMQDVLHIKTDTIP